MKTARKRARPAVRHRRPMKQTEPISSVAQFLHRTFYYLKAEQFLKTSARLLSEAV